MTRWFDLSPCDASFFDTAPQRHVHTMDLPVPAGRVWEGLAGDAPLSWCRMLSGGRYTSARPYGVGTTREITAGRLLRLREQFLLWEEGRRHAFWVTQANMPLFRRFAEDYLVEPTPTGCRFTWTFAYESAPALAHPGKVARLPNEALFRSLVHDTKRHFRRA